MSSFENNVYILYKHAFWSKSSVKELKSHLLLFCLSAVLFVLQCLSAYVHDINTEDMELENNSTELWQYQHLNNNLLSYTFTITKYIAREGIHTCAWSDQVHLRSLFMLHVWVDYVQVFSYKYFLAITTRLVMSSPQYMVVCSLCFLSCSEFTCSERAFTVSFMLHHRR